MSLKRRVRGKKRKIEEELDSLAKSACFKERVISGMTMDNDAVDVNRPHVDPCTSQQVEVEQGSPVQLPDPEPDICTPCVMQHQQQDECSQLIQQYGYVLSTIGAQLDNLIPACFKHHKLKYITTVLKHVLPCTAINYVHDPCIPNSETIEELLQGIPKTMRDLCGMPSVEMLWKVTLDSGSPMNLFLGPPVTVCLECDATLHIHNPPVRVVCYTNTGPLPAQKITLRCKKCDITYRYHQFGNSKEGYRFYDDRRSFVQASNVCYVERCVCEQFIAAGHHCWASFEGSSEVYNEVMRETCNLNFSNLKKYLNKYPMKDDGSTGEESTFSACHELGRKTVANAFWNFQVEEELREARDVQRCFQGGVNDRDKYMQMIDLQRAKSPYSHECDSKECKSRGCGKLYAIDGNWKIKYPVCMFQTKKQVKAFAGNLRYVDTCPNSPVYGMAFCEVHCATVAAMGIPTRLQEYLKHQKNKNKEASRQSVAVSATSSTSTGSIINSAADCQGTSSMVADFSTFSIAIDGADEVPETRTMCNKDTGGRKTLQKWSRGTWFCVSGGGHINTWQPLYQSEGPAQVFFLLLTWLVAQFGHLGRDKWKDITIAYDNMCHLNNLTVARSPLPLPGSLQHIWSDVKKVIDELHMKNHKDPSCKLKYSTESLKADNPDFNTMACEQTFAWLSRYKKILCAMQRTHFHFYLHRMIKRRNNYISFCYLNNRRPLNPKPKNFG